ncbi:MAG: phosphatase PAP2 family protein [Ruminococcaceae bacterium]|nr:phosphatase PAP2 family protein [Oscillospiraceae bacterium]
MTPMVFAAASLGDKLDTVFYGFDMAVFEFFGSIQSGFMTQAAKFFTSFGDSVFVALLAVLAVVLSLFKRTRKYGFSILLSILIGTLITNIVLKPWVLRIRPYNTLQGDPDYWSWYVGAGMLSESDYSFPSGHVTAAFEIATAMFLCFWTEGKKKLAWVFPALGFIVLCTRLYLMVHYASDVLFGVLAGVFGGVCGYLLGYLCRRIALKVKFLDAIDLERLFKKGVNTKAAKIAVWACVGLIFCASYVPLLFEGGEEAHRCAYVGEYDCQNEARVDDDDYPPIDGKFYCKIHWNQLSGK